MDSRIVTVLAFILGTSVPIQSHTTPVVAFIGSPFGGREDSEFVAITVGVMEPEKLEREVSVNLTTEDYVGISNPATAGVDYTPLDVTLTFSENVTVITVNVTLLVDNTVEGDEDFRVRLSTSSGSNVGFPNLVAIIAILDTSRVTIGFEEETVQVDENVGMKTLCVNVLRGQLVRYTIASVSNQDQTAFNRWDYSFQQMTFIFLRDNTRHCFNVSILDDDINEPEKEFLVMLTTSDSHVDLSPNMATITIIDNDGVTIGFEEETAQVDENIGTKTLCVNVSRGQLVRTTTVSVSSQDQTAIIQEDYSFQQMTFNFSRDNTRQCFDVGILDDDINEPEKKFFVMLNTGDPQVTLSPNTATITIIDNDEVVIGFFSESYSISESDGTASIEFGIITGSLGTNISVRLGLSDRSALSGSDYSSSARVYSLTGRETVTVDIGIIGDDKFEHVEVFYASLSFVVVPPRVTLQPDQTEINIIDNDEVTIGFEQTTYSVNEGNVVEVCAVLTGTLNRSLEVFVNSSSGSATVAEDYNPVHETLTFGPTSNRTCFNFTTLGDEIHEEGMEDLNLHLSTMALNVTLDPFLAHIHILDHERAIGHTIPTVNNTTSNNWFNIFAIACAVVLLVVAMMIIVIVMIVALRCHHSALDLQKNNRSEPLPAISITGEAAEKDLDSHVYDDIYKYNKTNSQPAATHPPTLPPMPASITGEAVEKDLDSHVYDDIYKHNKSNSQPTATHTPTLPPMTASRNGEYKLTTCPAYASIDLKNIPTSRNGEYELTTCPAYAPTDIKNIPISASRNGEYELTTCPAYAPTNNIQSMPDKETKDGHYEIVVNTKPTIPPRMPASRNGGYEMTNCLAYAPSDIQSTTKEKTEDKL